MYLLLQVQFLGEVFNQMSHNRTSLKERKMFRTDLVDSTKISTSVGRRLSSVLRLFTYKKMFDKYLILQTRRSQLIGAIIQLGQEKVRIEKFIEKSPRYGFKYEYSYL